MQISFPQSPSLESTPQLFHFCQDDPIQWPQELPKPEIKDVLVKLLKIVKILRDSDEFTKMPIDDLLRISVQKYGVHKEQTDSLTILIKKYKNIEKRNKAKRRKISQPLVYQSQDYAVHMDQHLVENQNPTVQTEIKKQRNRMSAQISRDRKKIYVKTLQTENKELICKAETLRIENQKLKLAILEKQNPRKNNKFMRLLLLLGIFFFVCLVKDALGFKSNKSNKINNSKIRKFGNGEKVENLNSNGFMEEIQRQIRNEDCQEIQSLDGQKQNNQKGGLKEAILTKISSFKKNSQDCILPQTISSLLLQAKTLRTF